MGLESNCHIFDGTQSSGAQGTDVFAQSFLPTPCLSIFAVVVLLSKWAFSSGCKPGTVKEGSAQATATDILQGMVASAFFRKHGVIQIRLSTSWRVVAMPLRDRPANLTLQVSSGAVLGLTP